MVTLTDKQADRMVSALEKLLRSANDLKQYNTIRTLLLTMRKKQRYELHNKRKSIRKRTDN